MWDFQRVQSNFRTFLWATFVHMSHYTPQFSSLGRAQGRQCLLSSPGWLQTGAAQWALYPSPAAMQEPAGRLETSAVEMPGLAPGQPASQPGEGLARFSAFVLIQVRHTAVKTENKQWMFPRPLFQFK